MKRLFYIGFMSLYLVTACTRFNDDLVKNRFIASPELLAIDSLMWYHPDSALIQLMYYFKPDGDTVTISSREEYDQHYAYLLLSELLFKNNYPQTNRTKLLKSVDYFDSLLVVDGADTRGVSLPFLSARVHYMNGVGLCENDSVVEACTEYLRALEIMEKQFPLVETQNFASLQPNHIPRFMMLIYCRLGGLFSNHYMQEPALICFKKALAFNRLEPFTLSTYSDMLYWIGFQYDKLQQWDSATYYYDKALQQLPDTNDWHFRVLMSNKANLNYRLGNYIEPAVSDMKRVAVQGRSYEKPNHFFNIGQVYYDAKQYDSALVYLTPAFEQSTEDEIKTLAARYLHDVHQSRGDTLKSAQYAVYLAEHTDQERVEMARVSQLNELFQNYLRKKQEAASSYERRKAVRTVLAIVLPLALMMAAFVVVLTWRRSKKQLAAHEAETQRRLSEAAQHTLEVLQRRVMTIYQSGDKNRFEHILTEFEAVYPKALQELAVKHPDLNETERHIAVLNFLHFRSKEEAELMGFTEYTALKYRSNLKKKAGSAPISAMFDAGKI